MFFVAFATVHYCSDHHIILNGKSFTHYNVSYNTLNCEQIEKVFISKLFKYFCGSLPSK